jgi:hypothetical protein
MTKELKNVLLSFGAILIMVVSGSYAYAKREQLLLQIEKYEEIALKSDEDYEQYVIARVLAEREREELRAKAEADKQSEAEALARRRSEENLAYQQQLAEAQLAEQIAIQNAADALALEQARQKQIADAAARQAKLDAQKAAAKKASRSSRAS